MIFVITGSQKFQFDRLLKELDILIDTNKINQEIMAQIGNSNYIPKNYKYKDFLDRNEFNEILDKSSVVITHGGTGAIIGALKRGMKVIAVPRLAEYNECVDNHQIELIRAFGSENLIIECLEIEELSKCIEMLEKFEPIKYKSNTKNIINSIESFISKI